MRKRFEELKKKYQVNVVYLLFFFGVLLIATFLRVQSIPQLKGKYLLGTDAYRFLRQAEYLSEHSRLPERDMMRWLPIGRDLTQQLSLSSYVIAYLYKFCRLFYPSLTVYKAAVYYPIFLYLVTLVVLYLLAKRLLNSATALLTVAILAVSQSTLHRSMAGFSDRDSLSLLLAVSSFYFYIRAVQATGLRSRLIHSSVSGVIMMLLGLTWEGVGLFILVIVLLHAAKLIFDDYTKHDFYPYLCWLGPIVAGLLTLTRTYRGGANYSSPFASIALGIPLLFAMVASIYLSSRRFPAFVDKLTLSHRLPLGVCIVTGLIILISFTVFGLAFFSPDASHWLSAIKNNFLSPLGQSRLMQNVSELTDFSLSLWIQAYRLFFLCFTAGILLSLYQFCRNLKLNPWIVMVSFELVLINIFYRNVPPDFLLNVRDPTSLSYLGSLFVFIIIVSFLRIRRHWKGHRYHEENLGKVDDGTLLLGMWFLLTLLATKGAIRYNFFFAPAATIYGAYALVQLHHWLLKSERSESLFVTTALAVLCWEAYILLRPKFPLGIIIVIIITGLLVGVTLRHLLRRPGVYRLLRCLGLGAFLGFLICLTSLVATIGGFAKVSLEISKSLHPVISSSHPSWKESLDWMKDNLPQDAVIAAEWDYGSHINVLANRATIIDEDHYIPYWIYLFSRHVLCAQTEMEALEFLKTRGTTHLVIGGGDIQKFHKHSYLGADEKLDRHVVPVFLAQISEKDNPPEVHFLLTGHPNVDIEIDGKTYAPYEWYPKRIVLNVKPNPDDNTKELEIEKANIVVSAERKEFELSLEKLSLQGKEIIIESGSFPGGLIVSQIESEQKEDVKKWWAVYLPEVGYNALAIKLYLREIESPHFKLVYSSPNQEDNRINPLPHGVKVWEIIYPPDLEPNPAYLETEFKSKELYRSWMLGKSAVSK